MSLRYKLEYAGLRALLGLFGALPAPAASATGGFIFRMIGPLMGISKVGRRNIARAFPSWTRAHVNETLRGMWDNLGRVIAEYPHLEEIARERTAFTNSEIFEKLRTGEKPPLFISGHLGNWEVLPPALTFVQTLPMHSAYRAPNNPLVDAWLVKTRSFGGKLSSFGKNRRGLADIMRSLQNGHSVGMLIDQKMNTGIEATFFRYPVMTSTAFVELARKLGCPLVPGRIIRKPGCRFEISIENPVMVEGRETETIVAETHSILERWIAENPEQWLWIHRRWKDGKDQVSGPAPETGTMLDIAA